MKFKLETEYTLKGDQPQAVDRIEKRLKEGAYAQVLLGITGSGKTFSMANVIARLNRPALILAHNKTLAAQLYQEFKGFFPNNAVEYFVSYYDYFQPEAYLPRTDTYIEKDLAINDEIDKMRLSATRSLIERRDVVIVSSVSCIYGLGMPEHYARMHIKFAVGDSYRRDELLIRLVQMHYERHDITFVRGFFRVRGEVLEICPAYEEDIAYRIEFFDDRIEKITIIDALTGKVKERLEEITLYPASHFVTPEELREEAITRIKQELEERMAYFERENLLVERERIHQRTTYDLEMIREIGFCKGIENYSRLFAGRSEGEPPACLLDYFPDDFLLFIDESHQTVPQIRAMYNGDRARKKTLIDFGFRLPSAYDNRPLKIEEFYEKVSQVVYVSATPAPFEITEAEGEIVEQIIRPTGLLDPIIEIRKAEGQVDDLLEMIRVHVQTGGRILVTTLTKRLAEDVTKYLLELEIKAKYLHSDISTLERVQILRDLRLGIFDVLVGINLLREGLDLPEVSLVAILDADKEGFLRSETSLMQTCGRAARNAEGRVIMYADKMTEAIRKTVTTTEKRRKIQMAYNEKHGIIPKTIKRDLGVEMGISKEILEPEKEKKEAHLTQKEIEKKISYYRKEMNKAAREFRFEDAATLRDKMHEYQKLEIRLG
jgi:excinuclease ABC subunit B